MKKSLYVLLLSLLSVSFAHAAEAVASKKTDKPDDSRLSQFLQDYVYELDHPIYVYNWFNGNRRNPIWLTKLSAQDSAGFDHMTNESVLYWQSLCTNDASLNPSDCPAQRPQFEGVNNMFGPGLYAAVDPVATQSYGGGNGWVLMQMHLPKGFRMLDGRGDTGVFPLFASEVLENFGCPAHWLDQQNNGYGGYTGINALLNASAIYTQGGSINVTDPSGVTTATKISDTCILEVRHLLKDVLKIDAFYYSYNGTSFQQCSNSKAAPLNTSDPAQYSTQLYNSIFSSNGNSSSDLLRMGAFVIASTKGVTASDVKIFNSQTVDGNDDRIRIQSLFYAAKNSAGQTSGYGLLTLLQQALMAQPVPDHPDYQYTNLSPNSTYVMMNGTYGTQIQWQATACPKNPTAVVTTVTTSNASSGVSATANACIQSQVDPPKLDLSSSFPATITKDWANLLWSDIVGSATPTDLTTWMKSSLYGCDQQRDFDAE